MCRKLFYILTVVAATGTSVQRASAAGMSFSNVTINGSLSTGATVNLDSGMLDLILPDATVGDGFASRSGNLVLTYVVECPAPLTMDSNLLSILGALSGSGKIFFNEVVEDIADPAHPAILATHQVLLDDFADLPYVATLNFSRPSTKIKVKKTLLIMAPDTPDFDLASVLLVEQTLSVPEPGSLVLLTAGAMMLRRRSGRDGRIVDRRVA